VPVGQVPEGTRVQGSQQRGDGLRLQTDVPRDEGEKEEAQGEEEGEVA
jgi:hypothetical protein